MKTACTMGAREREQGARVLPPRHAHSRLQHATCEASWSPGGSCWHQVTVVVGGIVLIGLFDR